MNRYVRDLLQELGVHRYDKALWTLGEYSWANPDDGFPDLSELLDQHKTGIMRALLKEIDELNTDDMLYFVPQVLSALRSSGVTWPELDIIRRSMMRAVRQDDPIDEAFNPHAKQDAEHAARGVSSVLQAFSDMDPAERAKQYIKWVHLIYFVPRGWVQLLEPILNHHKTMIVGDLLRSMTKHQDRLWTVSDAVDALAYARMPWPELAIIRRSLHAEKSRQALSEGPDLRRYVKQDGGTMFIRMPVDEIWHTDGRGYWTGVAKPVRVLDIKQDMEPTGDLSGWIGDLAVYFDTDTWDTDRDGLIYTDPQFLKDLKNLFLRMGIPREIVDEISYSEQGAQGDDWVSFDANAFADYVADQFIIGDAATMEQRKPEIMRQLLTMIKQGGTVRVTALIQKLRELGADWPEFAAIERSIAAVRKPVAEVHDDRRDRDMAVLDRLLRDGPVNGVDSFAGAIDLMQELYADEPNMMDTATKALETHRENIIRSLLNSIKDYVASKHILTDIRKLQHIGAMWPELDIMKRSLSKRSRHLRESQTRHRPALRAAQQALRDGKLGDAINKTMHAVQMGLPREAAKSLFDRYERRIRPLVQQETDPLTRWNTAGDLLGRIGVNWPWLDHVRARGHGKMDESYRESPGMMAHYAKTIKHSLDNKRDWQVGYDFQKLGNVDTRQVYDEFKHLAPDLAEWYLRIVATDPDLGGIPAIESLHRAWQYMGDLYPKIRHAVEDSKPQVMRALLKAITLDQDGGNMEHVLRVIRDMRDMDIAWPELKTIARSISPRRSREP